MQRLFRNGRYANVTATLALIVALGGTSYAAITLPKNSVGNKQLRKNAVSASKIRTGAVTSAKIKNGSIEAADLKLGTLPATLKGDKGDKGDPGTNLTGQTPLASGKSQSGFFAAGGGNSTTGYIADSITFQQPLAAGISGANIVYNAPGVTTPNCLGPGQAAPGYLCFYVNEQNAVTLCCIYNQALQNPAIDKNGGIIYWYVNATTSFASGQWTVTAP